MTATETGYSELEEFQLGQALIAGESGEVLRRYEEYERAGVPPSQWESRYRMDAERENDAAKQKGHGGVTFTGLAEPTDDWARWVHALTEAGRLDFRDREAALHATQIKGVSCAVCGTSRGVVSRYDDGERVVGTCFANGCKPIDVGEALGVHRPVFPMPARPAPEDDPYLRPVTAVRSYDRHSTSDAHLGERVAREYLAGRFVSWGRSAWSEWDGRRWQRCTDSTALEAVRAALLDVYGVETIKANERLERKQAEIREAAYDDDADGTERKRANDAAAKEHSDRLRSLRPLQTIGKITAVLRVARGVLEVRQEVFDNNPDLLNVGNGVVDLATGELRPHDPALMFTKISDVNYHPGAQHDDWSKALTALPLDVRAWMQLRFGQAATGHATTDDIVPFLKGGGGNGKSTILVGVDKALGDFAVVVPDKVLLASPSDHPTELMTLHGARLAFIEELPEGDYLNVQRLKKAVGTDHMTARLIGQDNVTWSATHSLMVTTNYDVQVDGVDTGTWRRLALVTFPYTFSGPNPDMPPDPTLRIRVKEGRAQQEAALAWIVDGARRWYEAERVMDAAPTSVARDSTTWRYEANHAARFFDEYMEEEPNTAVRSVDVYKLFKVWAAEHGLRQWSDRLFWQRVRHHGSFQSGAVDKPKDATRTGVWVVSNPSAAVIRDREPLVTGAAFAAAAVERLRFM